MNFAEEFKHTLFEINEKTFTESSLAAFEYQYKACDIYKSYCNYLHKSPATVKNLTDIPFIPIEFFKNHAIKSGNWKEKKIFKSSGTTSTTRSQHFIRDIDHYHRVARHTFQEKIGQLSEFKIFAVLPSYQEQGDSSLISMVDNFMNYSHSASNYFLNQDWDDLLNQAGKKLVIGVSYALLDIAAQRPSSSNLTVVETGGMKGRRKEITRYELHSELKEGFKVNEVWSEYGMTELQSQAYGKNGAFEFPKWAKCIIRDINDPFSFQKEGKTGGINIIDLANIDTCCFIETKDLGRIVSNGFEVLGRFDNSDIRGCNLMI
ncbi:MAG: acyl transferase [Ekhidna sp.]